MASGFEFGEMLVAKQGSYNLRPLGARNRYGERYTRYRDAFHKPLKRKPKIDTLKSIRQFNSDA
jgi:hypothetical protein